VRCCRLIDGRRHVLFVWPAKNGRGLRGKSIVAGKVDGRSKRCWWIMEESRGLYNYAVDECRGRSRFPGKVEKRGVSFFVCMYVSLVTLSMSPAFRPEISTFKRK